jgi:hypothetical protein
MATRTIVQLTDDLDGKPATETVRFSLDGRDYEIDLSEKNARALRKDLQPWTTAAYRTPRSRTGSTSRLETGVDSTAVRAWAASNGIELSPAAGSPATSSTSTEPPATHDAALPARGPRPSGRLSGPRTPFPRPHAIARPGAADADNGQLCLIADQYTRRASLSLMRW